MSVVDQMSAGLVRPPVQLQLWSKIRPGLTIPFGTALSFNTSGVQLPLGKIGWHGYRASVRYEDSQERLIVDLESASGDRSFKVVAATVPFDALTGELVMALLSMALESVSSTVH